MPCASSSRTRRRRGRSSDPDSMSETAAAPAPRAAHHRRTTARRARARRPVVAAAAEKLHLDPKVIEALEADRFAELGASVYVRGHLRRYADFVGEAGLEMVNAYSAREASPPPPDLTQIPHAEHRADPAPPDLAAGRPRLRAGAGARHLVGAGRLRIPSFRALPTPQACGGRERPAGDRRRARGPGVADCRWPTRHPPLHAAAAQNATATAAVDGAPCRRPRRSGRRRARRRLRLELTSESWVEVYDSRGERLFYDVASAGSVQSIEGRPPLRVVLGNAAAVSVQVDGQSREIPASCRRRRRRAFRRESIRLPGPRAPVRLPMSRNLQPVTGMKDVLAAEIGAWQHVERTAAQVLAAYGYQEIPRAHRRAHRALQARHR